MSRLRRNLTWWKHARYVADLLRQHDGCTVVSEREYGLVKQIAPESLKVRVVPNGVDLAHLDGNFGAPLPGTLIYTGALTYSANLDAMRYFVGEILPLIVVQQPDVKLAITGSIADIPADQLPAHPCVDFTGYLPDIRPAVAQSTVSVVPLRVGGGTRLKILESLALGTPVVTTSKGLEGLDIAAGEGVLIADEPEDFAEAVLRVLQDAALRSDLSRDGRRAVQQYDWARVGPQLVRFVAELAASAREPVL
jgi:glycosyltransferase involved in cell wall biosynthesis